MNYDWNDFVIVGDSFCAMRDDKDSWLQQVLLHFTKDTFKKSRVPRGKGFSGGAWWSYRKELLVELQTKTPKVLIICHTEPYRIPNEFDYGINFRSVDEKRKTLPSNITKAADMYYKELFSFEFYDWAVKQWFIELDKLCDNIDKVIHLYCFEGDYTKYTFNKGTTVVGPLISYAELPKKYFWKFKSKVLNHFSPKSNKLFANTIIDLIENYQGDKTRLDIKLIDYGTN